MVHVRHKRKVLRSWWGNLVHVRHKRKALKFCWENLVHVRHERNAYEVLVGKSGACETQEKETHGRNTRYGSDFHYPTFQLSN